MPPVESKDDPLVEEINNVSYRLASSAIPGAYLVETFPFMKYLPSWMAKWKREGIEWHLKASVMFEGLIEGVRETILSGWPSCL